MDSRFASCGFLFCVLLILLCIHSKSWKDVDREENNLQQTSIDDAKQAHKDMHANHVHDESPSSPMDPSLNVFFTVDDLKLGKRIPIYFSTKNLSTSPHLLPREEADSIPFSSARLPELLDFFSFPKGSRQAEAIEYTLRECELEPIKGEAKFCATSLESMLDSARGFFGSDPRVKPLTTNHISKHTALLQNYTVLEVPKLISTPKMVACHSMPYPYAVFYCHGQERDHKVFKLSLGGDNGERVEAVGVCHVDTSHWNSDHVAFRVLKTRPGDSPVCHFFPADNLIWVASPTITKFVV
ncbi:hypothetical protein U1Q18_003870 [Sarracenia purpurea var. burkii]